MTDLEHHGEKPAGYHSTGALPPGRCRCVYGNWQWVSRGFRNEAKNVEVKQTLIGLMIRRV